ncbi:MAG: ABC transporter permease [Acidimicrobiia bacterium]|nr:ABC transporter permease [Acidimicrobiia bacterium]
MFRVEMSKTRRRARTWVLAVALVVPVAVAVGAFGSQLVDASGRTATQIGTAASPAALLPFLGLLLIAALPLPVVGAVVGGTAFGADTADGTLRYWLVRPVGRTRMYLDKLGVVVLFSFLVALAVLVAAVLVVLAVFGPGEVRPLAATTGTGGVTTGLVDLGVGEWLLRLGFSAGYVAFLACAVASVAVAVGLRAESTAVGAAVAVLVLVASAGLATIEWIGPLRGVLLGRWLTTWTTMFTDPPRWSDMIAGATCAFAWLVVSTVAGVWWFRRCDVTC